LIFFWLVLWDFRLLNNKYYLPCHIIRLPHINPI
jgi:hypothetical protein